MQKNRLPFLGGVLAILVGVAWGTGVFDRNPTTVRVPDVSIPADAVDAISLHAPGWSAELARTDAGWRLLEPVQGKADSVTVARLVEDLGGISLASVVSTNPDRYARYGVDSTAATTVTARWGTEAATLVVASEGRDYASSYVRVDDGIGVFATRSRLALPTGLDRLRDKVLVNIDPAWVVAADVTTPEHAYALAYGGDGWTIAVDGAAPVAADSTRIAGWLRRFSPLRMDGFFDGLAPDSVEAVWSVRFAQANGRTVVVSMGERDDALAAFSDGPVVMRALSSRRTTLFEAPDGLVAR